MVILPWVKLSTSHPSSCCQDDFQRSFSDQSFPHSKPSHPGQGSNSCTWHIWHHNLYLTLHLHTALEHWSSLFLHTSCSLHGVSAVWNVLSTFLLHTYSLFHIYDCNIHWCFVTLSWTSQWEYPLLHYFTPLHMLHLFHTSHTVVFFIDKAIFPTRLWVP